MGRRSGFTVALGVGVVMASALAGCGSSSSGLGLTAYLVHRGQETGFHTQGAPTVKKSLQSYMASDYGSGSDPTRLQAQGFKRFATVGTAGPGGEQGGSFALEVGSPSAAAQEQATSLAYARQNQGGAKLVPFTVPGVPGATGVHAAGSTATSNVYWHEGRCVLWVGDTDSDGPVIAAAQAIYGSTHARNGACGG